LCGLPPNPYEFASLSTVADADAIWNTFLMVTQNHLRKHTGVLDLSSDSSCGTVVSMHRETPLGQVVADLDDQHYVVATDDELRITGLVSVEQIYDRLNSKNHYERKRWQQMPLSSLLTVTFNPQDARSPVKVASSLECMAVAEGDRMFGIAVDDDIFLSWRRLESMLSVALSDPLTGLLNRLAYERRLHEEWNRAARTGMSVGVVVVDLDNFKRINDTMGHTAGDVVLRGVGHQLESSMRSYDVVARFGGDEFVALCLGCAAGNIAIPIERIQQAIAAMDLTFEGTPIPVSVSIGAAVRHNAFETSDPRDLFSAADECLYHAKASRESAWKVELGTEYTGVPEPVQFDVKDHTSDLLKTANR